MENRPLLILLALTGFCTITLTKSSTTRHQSNDNKERKAEPILDDSKTVPSYLTTTAVECGDNQKFCECPKDAVACRFSALKVEELQTFVSYKYEDEKDPMTGHTVERLQTRTMKFDRAGDAYYLNGRGFNPSLPPPPAEHISPKYGNCSFYNMDVTENTFKEHHCSVPTTVDGSTYRMFIAVNGQIPGPTLIVYEGQIVRIRVHNKLTSEGISVHWHGLHQKQTPWMDGVGFVTQAPIIPGAYFDYVFNASSAGTYWYHSHVGPQRTDGLYGALIVKEIQYLLNDQIPITGGVHVNDIPEYHTISLLDWQRISSLNLFCEEHSMLGFFPNKEVDEVPNQLNDLYTPTRSADGAKVGPVPFWSGLMNGKGRHDQDMFSILSIFNVTRGQRYRFRLIGAQGLYALKFSIDSHRLILIASDGRLIQPKVVNFIIIHSGERYDFILDAYQAIHNYWMRAETLEVNINTVHQAEGILHYQGAHEPNPWNKYTDIEDRRKECSYTDRCVAVNCPFESFPWVMHTKCLHLDELSAYIPSGSDTRPPPRKLHRSDPNLFFFNFGFEGISQISAINSMNLLFPTTPYSTYCNQYEDEVESQDHILCPHLKPGENYNSSYITCINIAQVATSYSYQLNKTEYPSVNFVLSSVGSDHYFSHPIHLHGHHFRVVAIRHGKYDGSGKLIRNNQEISCSGAAKCPAPTWKDIPPKFMRGGRVDKRAIHKDTVIVPAGGYVVIAFEANSPGYWFMHCHIESHLLQGMGLIVQEYPPDQQWAPPPHINRVGNFKWYVHDYLTSINAASKCCIRTGNQTRRDSGEGCNEEQTTVDG